MNDVAIRNEYILYSLNRNRNPETPAIMTKINDKTADIMSFVLCIFILSRSIMNETMRIRNPSIM
jgi:hypothetical protein